MFLGKVRRVQKEVQTVQSFFFSFRSFWTLRFVDMLFLLKWILQTVLDTNIFFLNKKIEECHCIHRIHPDLLPNHRMLFAADI